MATTKKAWENKQQAAQQPVPVECIPILKDSGKRTQFETGAVRDVSEGKGRCDLLPLNIVGGYLGRDEFKHIEKFIRTGDIPSLFLAIDLFRHDQEWTKEELILEVSKHYEAGCTKYGERNWEKGIPLSRYIDSGVRHLLKHSNGNTDERHDRAFVWNMFGAIWTAQNYRSMCDLPYMQTIKEEADNE